MNVTVFSFNSLAHEVSKFRSGDQTEFLVSNNNVGFP